jgi:hypothetical protein
VAHTCNPSYSGGSDQEDVVQSQSRQIVPQDPISKKKIPSQKGTGGVAQSIGPQNYTKIQFLQHGLGKIYSGGKGPYKDKNLDIFLTLVLR